MDLVALWEHVPDLLAACVCDNIPGLRNLRLVCKHASRVALLGLRSHSLTLKGLESFRNVRGARLLRHTCLQSLSVHLIVSDSFNPSVLLEMFVREASASFNTVTNLDLHLQDAPSKIASAQRMCTDSLSQALASLVTACPVLRTLTNQGHMSLAFLRRLGETCPLLTSLTVFGSDASDLPRLQDIVSLQPPLLPHLCSLTFQHLTSNYQFMLPDMSMNRTVTTLNMSTILDPSDWLLLPKTLQHLCCGAINARPSTLSDDTFVFPSLLSIEVALGIQLPALAQLLRAAPLLRDINVMPTNYKLDVLSICCFFNASEAASHIRDFALLQRMIHTHIFIKNAQFVISSRPRKPRAFSDPSWLSALPPMNGVERCTFRGLHPGALGVLLNVFPSVTDISLDSMYELTDIELQDVSKCHFLTKLYIASCKHLSLAGLLSLCLRCPSLSFVDCRHCDQLKGPVAVVCRQLLLKHGKLLTIVDE